MPFLPTRMTCVLTSLALCPRQYFAAEGLGQFDPDPDPVEQAGGCIRRSTSAISRLTSGHLLLGLPLMTNGSHRLSMWFGWAYYFSSPNLRVGLP
jgi:hypothetical protein